MFLIWRCFLLLHILLTNYKNLVKLRIVRLKPQECPPYFCNQILFNIFLSLPDTFQSLTQIKVILRYKLSKPESSIGCLQKGQTKKAKKDYFIKHLTPATFFEKLFLNFQFVFTNILGKLKLKFYLRQKDPFF